MIALDAAQFIHRSILRYSVVEVVSEALDFDRRGRNAIANELSKRVCASAPIFGGLIFRDEPWQDAPGFRNPRH
jgi:hypothetical protein